MSNSPPKEVRDLVTPTTINKTPVPLPKPRLLPTDSKTSPKKLPQQLLDTFNVSESSSSGNVVGGDIYQVIRKAAPPLVPVKPIRSVAPKPVAKVAPVQSTQNFTQVNSKQNQSVSDQKKAFESQLGEKLKQKLVHDDVKTRNVAAKQVEETNSDNYEDMTELAIGRASILAEDEFVTAMDYVRCVTNNRKILWSNTTRVIDSRVKENLRKDQIEYLEVKFEIYTTEAFHLKSLRVLKNHFMKDTQLSNDTVLSRENYDLFFSNLKSVIKCSKAFLSDMDKCWKKHIYLPGLFDVIYKHSKKDFNVYIIYCSRLKDMLNKLKLLSENKKFNQVVTDLENCEECSYLKLDSYLTLPMSRITKLPLILEAALKVLTKNESSWEEKVYKTERHSLKRALDTLLTCSRRCDNDARLNDRMQELIQLRNMLSFPDNIAQFPLISPERWVLFNDEFKCLRWFEFEPQSKNSTNPVSTKKQGQLMLFLLSDMLVFTKIGSIRNNTYKVVDYCLREDIQLSFPSEFVSLNSDIVKDSTKQFKILINVQKNYNNRRLETIMSTPSKDDRDKWVSNLSF